MFSVDARDPVPVWKQIEDGVRRLVASGALRPGGLIPSVRDLARDLRVNPMTVSKAYQRLAEAGVLEVRRGEGTFVARGAPLMTRGEKTRELAEAAARFAAVGVTLGASIDEAIRAVDVAWQSLRPNGGRR
jgi:DNA-binding transcriptional regulator YhcF (GntR family)